MCCALLHTGRSRIDARHSLKVLRCCNWYLLLLLLLLRSCC
jgi:hypothetical protein